MPDINAPYPYFANPSKGVPLANGYIYIGLPDLDPTIPANQVTITARQEDGTNVALVQPIRTNAGGLPTYNGAVVQLQNLVTVVYSIQVLDASMVPIYYQAQAYGIPSLGSGGTPTALTLLDGTAAMPSLAFLNNLDTGLFYVAPNELHVSIDGQDTAHFRTDVTDSELVITSPAAATTEYYGDGEANAFRVGVAGGLSLLMDDNASRNFIIGTNSAERLRITDLGSITSGGLTTATVQPGGLDLQQAGTGFIQGFRSSAVATGITGTGAPDEMYGWVQALDADGNLIISGAGADVTGLTLTGYAGVVSTGFGTAPVVIDARNATGGALPANSNLFSVYNGGVPVFTVHDDGTITPDPVDNIDDLLIGGAFATGGAALNAAAAPSGGITIAQLGLIDGAAIAAQSPDVNHGVTSEAPTDTYFLLSGSEIDGGVGITGIGGTGTAMKLRAIASTANTGFINDGVYTLYASKADGILNQALLPTETLLTIYNGNSIVYSMLGDGSTNMAGGLTVNGAFTADSTTYVSSLSEQIIHTNPSTVQPFTAISTDPDVFGIIRSNLTVNGGYRVLGFAASTTAAYRVDAYTAAPASGFGLDSPIRFTGYKSNGGTGSTTIAATENVFSVWNQSSNCLLNITGNGNQTIAGSVVTGGGTLPGAADLGSLTVYTGGSDGTALSLANDDVVTPFTALEPANVYFSVRKVNTATGGAWLRGFTENIEGLRLTGYGVTASTSPLGGDAATVFDARKSIGTTSTSYATGEMLFAWANNSSGRMGLEASGNLFLAGGIATGGENAPDVDLGGVCIDHGANDGNALTIKNSDVNHPFTSIAESDTYLQIRKANSVLGGVRIQGFSESTHEQGIYLNGHAGMSSTSVLSAPVLVNCSISDGLTGTAIVPNTDVMFTITNNSSSAKFWIKGSGDLHTAGGLATGGENAPDVDSGGVCINHGANDGFALTAKNSDVNQPTTSLLQSDTYLALGKRSNTGGGARFWAANSGSTGALMFTVIEGTESTTNTQAAFRMQILKNDGGTGATSLTGDNVAVWIDNNNANLMTIRANGNTVLGGGLALNNATASGGLSGRELSADPPNPAEGGYVLWMSNGTGSGDDGDIMMKITAGAVTKTVTLVDFSAV